MAERSFHPIGTTDGGGLNSALNTCRYRHSSKRDREEREGAVVRSRLCEREREKRADFLNAISIRIISHAYPMRGPVDKEAPNRPRLRAVESIQQVGEGG